LSAFSTERQDWRPDENHTVRYPATVSPSTPGAALVNYNVGAALSKELAKIPIIMLEPRVGSKPEATRLRFAFRLSTKDRNRMRIRWSLEPSSHVTRPEVVAPSPYDRVRTPCHPNLTACGRILSHCAAKRQRRELSPLVTLTARQTKKGRSAVCGPTSLIHF
jgi:hypothetical protein